MITGMLSAFDTLHTAIRAIDSSPAKVGIVVHDGRPTRTITDGDVRRALLAGYGLEARIAAAINMAIEPVTAPASWPPDQVQALAADRHVRQVLRTDEEGRLVSVSTADDWAPAIAVRALVMAGGRGRRMSELTETTPKPLVWSGDGPLIASVLGQLRAAGVQDVTVALGYQAEQVQAYLASAWPGVQTVVERSPMGTAGALSMLWKDPAGPPVLVCNADLRTAIDLRRFVRAYGDAQVDAAVAMVPYSVGVPFGVLRLEHDRVVEIEEKPVRREWVSAGVYLLSSAVAQFVDGPMDMPDLLQDVIGAGLQVLGWPVYESWADVGRLEDLRP